MGLSTCYLAELKRRARESRIYREYQATGVEIAKILNDKKHVSLYIKLAKEGDAEALLALAKEVASRKETRKKGAYFMTVAVKEGLAVLGKRGKRNTNRRRIHYRR